MAIDTAAKRLSTSNLLTGITTLLPDSTIDQGDRQRLTLVYAGIEAAAEAVVTSLSLMALPGERHAAFVAKAAEGAGGSTSKLLTLTGVG